MHDPAAITLAFILLLVFSIAIGVTADALMADIEEMRRRKD
jgi:hypothetical protein